MKYNTKDPENQVKIKEKVIKKRLDRTMDEEFGLQLMEWGRKNPMIKTNEGRKKWWKSAWKKANEIERQLKIENRKPIKGERRYIKLVYQGRVTDVTITNFRGRPQIKKLNKTEYVILKTGEVKTVAEKENKDGIMRNRRSLQVIFRNMRQLINTNFDSEHKNQLAITLTYKPNDDGSPMRDDKRLYKDFKYFIDRVRYKYSEHVLEYIVIVEPQGWGAWHMHLLLKSTNHVELFIPKEEMTKLWGHGMTTTERLENVDQYGAYFVAYLTNLEITEENQAQLGVEDEDIEIKDGKRYIKGKRLKWYPDYMQIFRHSKGITKPKEYNKSISEGFDLDGILNRLGKLTYDNTKTISTEEGKELQITTKQYKKQNKG